MIVFLRLLNKHKDLQDESYNTETSYNKINKKGKGFYRKRKCTYLEVHVVTYLLHYLFGRID